MKSSEVGCLQLLRCGSAAVDTRCGALLAGSLGLCRWVPTLPLTTKITTTLAGSNARILCRTHSEPTKIMVLAVKGSPNLRIARFVDVRAGIGPHRAPHMPRKEQAMSIPLPGD